MLRVLAIGFSASLMIRICKMLCVMAAAAAAAEVLNMYKYCVSSVCILVYVSGTHGIFYFLLVPVLPLMGLQL
jgi:hypothetical protein